MAFTETEIEARIAEIKTELAALDKPNYRAGVVSVDRVGLRKSLMEEFKMWNQELQNMPCEEITVYDDPGL